MGHGLSLSGIFNFGHDVGGFAGPTPEPELFMRWIEQGIYWPRFTIHSWNDDGGASEPWMYPEILPLVRAAHDIGANGLRRCSTRSCGGRMPITSRSCARFSSTSRTKLNATKRTTLSCLAAIFLLRRLWSPALSAALSGFRGQRAAGTTSERARCLPCGENQVEAPLGAAPVFIRAGSILPLGPSPSWADGPLTLRLFPLAAGQTQLQILR